MGKIRTPEKTLLFVGALYADNGCYQKAYNLLMQSFGEVAMETAPFRWDYSDHYTQEMGNLLYRRFIFFKKLLEPGMLAETKMATNDIERSMSVEGRRRVNLDPGYLTLAKIVLATTKDYSHRIYLRGGIHAEVTLIYSKEAGEYLPNINTYNDYKDERHRKIFILGRELFGMMNRAV
ncbi:MAG TPA: DUF4416 family protein [Dissulfurispiraceae bacterium]|nr:DUF4416 family protein [Dissulfurispiraceae bacterium]